jgi:hypothetical protein
VFGQLVSISLVGRGEARPLRIVGYHDRNLFRRAHP